MWNANHFLQRIIFKLMLFINILGQFLKHLCNVANYHNIGIGFKCEYTYKSTCRLVVYVYM